MAYGCRTGNSLNSSDEVRKENIFPEYFSPYKNVETSLPIGFLLSTCTKLELYSSLSLHRSYLPTRLGNDELRLKMRFVCDQHNLTDSISRFRQSSLTVAATFWADWLQSSQNKSFQEQRSSLCVARICSSRAISSGENHKIKKSSGKSFQWWIIYLPTLFD